ALALFAATSARTVFWKGTDPRELEVAIPSPEAVTATRDQIVDIARRNPTTTIEIDSAAASQFPWAWYLRDLHVGYIDMTLPGYQPRGDVLLVAEPGVAALGGRLAGYRGREFSQREWWIRDYGKLTPAAFLRWDLHRTPFGEVGGSHQWIYVRR